MKMLQMILFLLVFLSIYAGMHLYVFFRLATLLELSKGAVFWSLLAGAALSFVIANMLISRWYSIFTRVVYAIGATWMGIAFLLFCVLGIHHIISLFVNIPGKASALVIIALVFVLTMGGIINAQTTNVKEIPLSGFGQELTVVQLTDVHIGTLYGGGYSKRIVEKVNNIGPDLVLITGDMVSGAAKLRPGMFDAFKDITAPVYAINGNHEEYEGKEDFARILKTADITLLNDEKIDFKGIQIVGIDYSYDRTHIAQVWPKLNISDAPSIVMHHVPPKRNLLRGTLVLSGHTHAGQIWPFNLLVRIETPFVHGLYRQGDTTLYVSPGTRLWGPPMRIGSRNEITVFRLS